MASVKEILDHVRQLDDYDNKNQCLDVLTRVFEKSKNQRKNDEESRSDREEATKFIFSEFERLIPLIPTVNDPKRKDKILTYQEILMNLLTIVCPDPESVSASDMMTVRTVHEVAASERKREYAIGAMFDLDSIGREDVEKVLDLFPEDLNEYSKGTLYEGILHSKKEFEKLTHDAKAVLAEYTHREFDRYLKKGGALDEDELHNLEIAADVCGYYADDALLSSLLELMSLGKTNVNFYGLSTLLSMGKEADREIVEGLAHDPIYANLTFELLKNYCLTEQYPKELANDEYLAKSDLIHWLTYPTELGMVPDDIEFLGKVKVKKETFHVFKFRSSSDTLTENLKNQWLIGWSSDDGGTFSEFDLLSDYEMDTPEKTLKNIRKKLL